MPLHAHAFTLKVCNFFLTYFIVRNKQYINSPNYEANRDTMSEKKRSKQEFETFIKTLFDRDSPKVKYQNPDAWRIPPQVKKKKDDD
jgi:hypothetical protein